MKKTPTKISKLNPKNKVSQFLTGIGIFIMLAGMLIYFDKPKNTEASWWNDSWTYRKSILVTNNASQEANVYISLTIDTSATSTIQDDCGDLRFTKSNGELLKYFIVSGCETSNTVIHVNFDIFEAGTQSIYYYYGNNSAENGFESGDFTTEASNYTIGAIGTEEVGPGPVGYWSFDEGYGTTAHDESGQGNHGTISGATWKNEEECVVGKCLYFDGNGDEVEVLDDDSLDITDAISINIWFKLNEYPNDFSYWRLLEKEGRVDGQRQGYDVFIDGPATSSTVGFERYLNGNSDGQSWMHSQDILTLNKWHMLTFVNDGNNSMIFYNGKLMVSSWSGDSLLKNDLNLFIGSDGSDGSFFKGFMDEIKIYPYARSLDQIKQDYNAGLAGVKSGKGKTVSFGGSSNKWMSDGLVGYWKFDESATSSGAIDSSGNGNDGVYISTASSSVGKFGSGSIFDGANDYVEVADSASLSPSEEITISSWFNPDETLSGTSDYFQTLIDSGSYSLFFDKTDGKIKFTLNSNEIESLSEVGDSNLNGIIYSMAVYNEDLYIGGSFTNAGGNPNADRIAKWDGVSWSDVGGVSLNGSVFGFTVYKGDLYVVGQFTNLGGNPNADYIAKWDGTSWSDVGGVSLNSGAYNMAVYKGSLYVGGFFTNAGGNPNADYIAKWNGTSWSDVGGISLDWFVMSMSVYNDNLYVGGYFQNAGGNPNADRIAKWDGTSWSDVGGTSLSGTVLSLVVYNGELYVGGSFANAGGNPNADRIAKWDGTSWSDVGGTALSNSPITMTVYNGELYMGGDFIDAGGNLNADYIAKWDGTSWSDVGGVTLNETVYALAVYKNKLHVGGHFTDVSGQEDLDYIFKFGSDKDVELASVTNNWPENTWQNIIGTYDGREAKIFVNGILENSISVSTSLYNSAQDIYIAKSHGSRSGSYGSGLDEGVLKGSLDELRIYKRALSPSEVQKLYEWAPGPVAYWKFDEKSGSDLFDSSGNENHGTITGALWNRGKYGGALDFDGVNDYVNVGQKDSLDLPDAMTACFWINVDAYPAEDTSVISNNTQYRIEAEPGGSIEMWWSYSGYGHIRSGNGTYTPGQWDHICVVRNDNAASGKIYANGLEKDVSFKSWLVAPSASSYTAIGRPGSSNFEYFKGKIDDLRIYNYARTQKQILEDMHNGDPMKGAVLDLRFDEGRGNIAYNASIHSNHGSLQPGTGGTNTASSAMWSLSGKNGGAMEFDGTDDYVIVPNNSSHHTKYGHTYSLWFKANSLTWSETLISKNRTGDMLSFFEGEGRLRYRLRTSAASTQKALYSNKIFEENHWYHLSITYDMNNIKMYVNGDLDNLLTATGTSANYDHDIIIGWEHTMDYSSEVFNGLIDEVKIFPFALNSDEIKRLYNDNKSTVLGSVSTDSSGAKTNSKNREYCVPGDTATCDPPVLELKFDEKSGGTAYDSSGNGFDGTLVNSPAWSRGKYGSALEFNGENNYVTLPTFNYNDITVEAWFYRTEADSVNADAIWGGWYWNADGQLQEGYDLRFYQGAPNTLVWSIVTTDSFTKVTHTNSCDLGNSQFEKWIHAVASYDSVTGKQNLYVDGELCNSNLRTAGNTIVPQTTYSDMRVGHSRVNNGYFNGVLDNVKVYSYARTPAQITYDYNGGKPIAHWRFDECSGSTIHDESGNGNHGTLNLGSSGVTTVGACANSSESFWYNGRNGKVNGAGSFDGSDDIINLPEDMTVYNSRPFTISAWTYLDGYGLGGASANPTIIQLKSDDGINGFLLMYSRNTNYQGIVFGDSDIVRGKTVGDISSSLVGSWKHLVLTYNGQGYSSLSNYKLYLDAEEQALQTSGSLVTTYINYIGRNWHSSSFFDGKLDDIKLYNYALTPEQIKTEYNGGAVRFGN